jgi:AcrR family transcriptional regulator
MPKETFYNLPEKKRDRILSTAVEEFATNSYDQASINRIVANAGIAKGSFYQYFEDKQDLFFYLLDLMVETKSTYISPYLQNPDQHDFFTLLREIYLSGLQFARDYPKYTEIGNRLLEDQNSAVFRKYSKSRSPIAEEYFTKLIDMAIDRKEIRNDIDRRLLVYMVASMNSMVIEYHARYVSKQYDETMMETLDTFIDFLKNGIAK